MDSGSKGSHRHRLAVSCVHFTLVDQMSAATSSHIDTVPSAKKPRVTRAARIRPVPSGRPQGNGNGSFRGNVPPAVHELHRIRALLTSDVIRNSVKAKFHWDQFLVTSS